MRMLPAGAENMSPTTSIIPAISDEEAGTGA